MCPSMYGRLARTYVAEAASRVTSCPDATNRISLHRIATHRAAGDELGLEAGQKLFDGGQSTGQKGVQLPSLRYRPAALSRRWEDLSLEDRHPGEVIAECARGQQPCDARADYHRVVSRVRHGSSVSWTRPAFVGEIPYFCGTWRSAKAAASPRRFRSSLVST